MDKDLLSGLEYFGGDQIDRPDVPIDVKVMDIHTEIAKNTVQVLYINMDPTVEPVPVLIKSVSFEKGRLNYSAVIADKRWPESEIWPHVEKALELQVDMIAKENSFMSKLKRFFKRKEK